MGENVDQRWVGWEGPRLRVLPILLTLFIGLAIIAVSFYPGDHHSTARGCAVDTATLATCHDRRSF
jgi:hypothetical protein